jgi:hypothetical protein
MDLPVGIQLATRRSMELARRFARVDYYQKSL